MKKISSLVVYVLLFFVSINSIAQAKLDSINKAREELKFIEHLINSKEHNDALFLLKDIHKKFPENYFTQQIKDSLNYLAAWSLYNQKKLDSSIVYFEKVSISSPVYFKSKFYETFEWIYLRNPEKAEKSIGKIDVKNDSLFLELAKMDLSICALLKKDFKKFDSISNTFSYNNVQFSEEQKELIEYKKQLQKVKHKSPLVAAGLSALVPGLGKYYAGYKGQAMAAFLPSAIFGVVAAENLYRRGPRDVQFILFASIFSIFYTGNIWGSAISVRTYREQQYNEIYNNIMLDLHIPLRRIFSE
jgi:hypothetical protein